MARWPDFIAAHMKYIAGQALPNDILVFQLNARSKENWGMALFRDHARDLKQIAIAHVQLEPGKIELAARRIARLARLKLIGEPTSRTVGHHQFRLR